MKYLIHIHTPTGLLNNKPIAKVAAKGDAINICIALNETVKNSKIYYFIKTL